MENKKMIVLTIQNLDNVKILISLRSKATKNGFYHEARAGLDTKLSEILQVRNSYINRTWESYEFEAVLKNLVSKMTKKFLGLENTTKGNEILRMVKNELRRKIELRDFRAELDF